MLGLGYLDCRLMVLGTRMYMAKNKVSSELSYASHIAAVKADKVKIDAKDKTDKMKATVKDKTDKIKAEAKIKSDKMKSDIKDSVEKVKAKVNEKKSSKEEVKTEEVKAVDVEFEDVKIEEIKTEEVKAEETKVEDVKAEEVKTVPINVSGANDPTIQSPDYSLLQGVYYDPETDNFSTIKNDDKEETTKGRVPTQEDIDIALKKIRENQEPK